MRELVIAGRRIADDEPAYVVAELGGTHNGCVETAKALIATAARAGADSIKFQRRTLETLYSQALLNQPYDNENSYGPTYGAHRKALEFDYDQYLCLQHVARAHRLTCFATAFDEEAVDFLMDLEMPALKVHSGGLTDLPLLKRCASAGVPVLLSTGGGTIEDIDRAHATLRNCPHAILHCTAAYPLAPAEANLRMVTTLRKRYPETVIGFSSHSPGIAFSLIAYAFGARIIEQHVTLNRASKGTDHAYALEPKGLETLCDDLKKLQVALGDGVKQFYDSERKPISKMRRTETPEGLRICG